MHPGGAADSERGSVRDKPGERFEGAEWEMSVGPGSRSRVQRSTAGILSVPMI